MASKQNLTLSDSQLVELQTISRSSRAERRLVDRVNIILAWHEGLTYKETLEKLGVSEMVIRKWRGRFVQNGLDGLRDAPRSGKPPKFSAADKARVIKLATGKQKEGYTNISQRRIAKELGMSQSKVHQVLKKADLKPHRTEYWCGKSTDPEFESKMINIIGLYMNPPENAIVLCVDEKTQIQALDRTQPVLPLRAGQPKRLTATYKRNGTVGLIAALAVHKGTVTAKPIEKNNAENFLSFLKELYRKNPRKELHIITDNLSSHKHASVKKWVASKRRLHIHFTPTYSSWLNQIEIWFNILTKDVIKGGEWKSKKQLINQLMEYVRNYNLDRAAPFKWTYTGEPLTA